MLAHTMVTARSLGLSLLPVAVALAAVIYAAPTWGAVLLAELDLWRNIVAPLAALGVLFAALFGQWRIVSAIALVLVAYLLTSNPPASALPGTAGLAVLTLTLGLAGLALLPERGLSGPAPVFAAATVVAALLVVTRGVPGVDPAVLDSVLRVGVFEAPMQPVIVAAAALPVLANQLGRPAVARGAVLAALICLLPVVGLGAEPSQLLVHVSVAIAALWIGMLAYAWKLAFVDELTGLANRRALKRRLRRDPVAIAMVDIDHFKSINDTYGHRVGDQVLRRVAGVLSSAGGMKVYRWGGEEFAIVLGTSDARRAELALDRLRVKLADSPFQMRIDRHDLDRRGRGGGRPLPVTASFGLAMVGPDESGEEALKRADTALYRAKEGGRNRVELAEVADD